MKFTKEDVFMKKGIKLLSLILAVIMVLSCAYIAGVSVSAAGEVVRFDNSVTKFSEVYCYLYGSDGENAEWPGEKMTNADDDIWSYEVNGAYNQVVFSNGDDVKSADAVYSAGEKLATPSGAEDGFTVEWSNFVPKDTQAPKATEKQAKLKTGAPSYTYYCYDDAGWGSMNCYMWNNSPKAENSGWPGVAMKKVDDKVWEYTTTTKYENIIFNGGGNQTGDLTTPTDTSIYYVGKKSWEPYSTSAVKITSFTASVDSPSYLGVSVVLNAAASSVNGGLTYKFSANGTPFYMGNQSSVAWSPTQVGTYKLTVDITDSKNESATRSITMEVKNASALEEPFISAFSNSLKTNTQIKRNSAVAFTLSALGGKVGTNLLFYKFVVEDPDGKPNTAYYTTSNSYVITPTKLGTYTITAYVQNSYNDTVEKTYKYTAVDNITEQSQGDTTPVPTQPYTGGGGGTQGMLGDVNSDNNISVKDATMIQQVVAKMTVTGYNEAVADVTRDGFINVKDATQIQKFLAKLIPSL